MTHYKTANVLVGNGIFLAAALVGLIYYVQSYNSLEWQSCAWMLVFATLILARFFLKTKDENFDPSAEKLKPGVYSVDTILYVLVLIYLSNMPDFSLDEFLADFWPPIAGYILGSLATLILRMSKLKKI